MFCTRICAAVCLLFVLSSSAIFAQLKIPFSFNLTSQSTISAGVFTKSGALVKTLWGGVKYDAGSHASFWDGTGDDGRLLSNGDYNIRVLSGNVTYTWEGIIGNTSSSFTGPGIYRSYLRPYSMVIAGNTAYASTYYNESRSSQFKFSLSNPQIKTDLLSSGQSSMFVATDGANVYWAGNDRGGSRWYVFATHVSDDRENAFSNGQVYNAPYGRTYSSVIDLVDNAYANISGLAVQKGGNFLFIARQNVNEIHVVDKSSGKLVNVISSIAAPGRLAVDGNGDLWIINALTGVINKYRVNSDGSLNTIPLLTVTGCVEPWSIAVSPDNSTLVVADGGASQQLKAFSNSTALAAWTYGQAGGYATDATVTDDKFYFTDLRHNNDGTFIAFQPDGSFWVEDPGNFRTQHFSANRSFLERIMYLPAFYGVSADPNNPSRVFSDWLEFNVDYSKPLLPNNGSWTLTKNWGHNITPTYNDRLRFVTTFSNGHTFAFIHANEYELVELMPHGDLRYTGFRTNSSAYEILKSGSLIEWGQVNVGTQFNAGIHLVTGFDGFNNPTWGTYNQGSFTPPSLASDPIFHGLGNVVRLASGRYVSFDAGLPPYSSSNYHLGAFENDHWVWKSAKSTYKEYNGPFPDDGSYDIGNSVAYGGSMAVALEKSIIWGYHGELWKGGETNYFNHVNEDGLLIAQFGTSGGSDSGPGVAGNVLSLSLVKAGEGNWYLYHNDENAHGGLHRWKLTGMETISEQTIPVTLTIPTGGLLTQYFEGDDLNNFNTKIVKINTTVNNNSVPSQISNPASYSSRWNGFISPSQTDIYTFYASTNGGVRLWVDNILVINNWNNTTSAETTGRFNCEAGKKYAIMLEMKNSTAVLSWSTTGISKQVVPSNSLTPAALPDLETGVDLLEGLQFRSLLESNLYGWKRDPKEEDTTGQQFNTWWTVKTGFQGYKKPDVYALFTQYNRNVIYTILRDLGKQEGSWRLSGHMSHEGDAPGPIDNVAAGGAFAVLDNAGKVIVSLTAYIDNRTGINYLYANNAIVAQAPAYDFNQVWGAIQPIEVSADQGLIRISFGPYPEVVVPPLDPTSNWSAPKAMGLYFKSNSSNRTRSADILDMRFFNAGLNTLLPVQLLSFKVRSVSNEVDLSWMPRQENNIASYTVERSTDRNTFTQLATVAALSQPGSPDYRFVDQSPIEGIAYYRLKIKELSGELTYSDIQSVNRKSTNLLSVFPNPVASELHITFVRPAEKGYLEILSSDGRKIMEVAIGAGVTGSVVDVRSLAPGYYLISINNSNLKLTVPFLKN